MSLQLFIFDSIINWIRLKYFILWGTWINRRRNWKTFIEKIAIVNLFISLSSRITVRKLHQTEKEVSETFKSIRMCYNIQMCVIMYLMIASLFTIHQNSYFWMKCIDRSYRKMQTIFKCCINNPSVPLCMG